MLATISCAVWHRLYHSNMHPVLTRNFEVFSACDWLAALTAHILNAGNTWRGITVGTVT